MKKIWLFLLLIVSTFTAFAQNPVKKDAGELLEVDKKFAKMSMEKGSAAAFAFFMAEDVVFAPMGEKLMTDKKAIIEYFSEGIVSLNWTPMKVEVSKSSDFGYTYGVSEMIFKDREGKTVKRFYNYVSVWRKNKDGEWKMIVDIGNPHPAPTPEKASDGAALPDLLTKNFPE